MHTVVVVDPIFFSAFSEFMVSCGHDLLNSNSHQVFYAVALLVKMESSWLFEFFSLDVSSMVSEAIAEFPPCFADVDPRTFSAVEFVNHIGGLTVKG